MGRDRKIQEEILKRDTVKLPRYALFTLMSLVVVCGSAKAQTSADSLTTKKPQYLVIVEQTDGTKTKGVLHSIDSISVNLINFHDSTVHLAIPAKQVQAIRYRKEGKIRKHALIGLGIGVGVGAIYGFSTYDAYQCDFNTCVEKGVDPLTTTVIGGILGAGTGAALGSRYTRIDLQGDPGKYAAAISFFEATDQ